MFNKPKQRGAIVTGILGNHGLNKEEIQELSDYIDSRGRELTSELTRPLWITFVVALVVLLVLPDQALIVGLKLLLSLVP